MRLDAQGFVRAVLANELEGVAVGVKVPNPRPDSFVLVKREGGGRQDKHRDNPGIGVFSWAETEDKAYNLAAKVSDIMLSLEYMSGVAEVVEETLTTAPDPKDESPRWYGSYSLTTYNIKE